MWERIACETKMVSIKCLLFQCIVTFSLTASYIHAQDADQSGFISIDCGLVSGPDPYADTDTGIIYKSDAGYIDSGESKSVSDYSSAGDKQFFTVRSFPDQGTIRSCYTIKLSQGKGQKYLIRARFKYGNYDSLSQPPQFDLYLGGDFWDTLIFTNNYYALQHREIIHVLTSDYVHVCLVNTGRGTPFISVLELRHLSSPNSIYKPIFGSLALWARWHYISQKQKPIRYEDDIYDRMWYFGGYNKNTTILTRTFDTSAVNNYRVPNIVLRTAIEQPSSSDFLQITWEMSDPTDQIYIYMHFAEVAELEANQSREFNIYINGVKMGNGLIVLGGSRLITWYTISPLSGSKSYIIILEKTSSSTLLPIINACEIHIAKTFSSSTTEESEVAAISSIKSSYKLPTKDWQGDPCFPDELVWDGLNCSYDNPNPARITSLNLTKRGLQGEIAPAIANLTMLKSLDLSNNNLNGEVPDFLSQLASLNFINLKGNKFTGPFPPQLLEKYKNGSLQLSFDDRANNTNTDCQSPPCKKKNKTSIVPLVGAVFGALVGTAVVFAAIFYGLTRFPRRRKKSGELERRKQKFTYSEVQNITNKFEKLLGEGSFGKVHHGRIGNTQVAVKMLSQSSDQGYKEFQTEVTILMSVSHKNLTSLVGYCNEGSHMGIIYEYMAKGSLYEHISERHYNVLGWEARLRIAMEAAQGLEYLHHGCKPAIVHRDVKPGNILLDEQFQGKLADFGFSKVYSVESGTHASTIHLAGTPGYLDPDYSTSNRLTVKSDVYSFGIVVLVMITGKHPAIILRNQEPTQIHITEWVDSYVQNGDIRGIVDPRFGGDYNVNSVGKAVELAMTCASKHPPERPTMKSVVIQLSDCLAIEISRD